MTYELDGIQVVVEDGVALASIDSGPLNLLDGRLLMALDGLAQAVAADERVRVLVLRSANPDFFIAHGDVALQLSIPETAGESAPKASPGFVHQILERFRTLPKVTIAEIAGFARGGGSEVALACDLRYAARERAVFGQPEIGLGILPGAGGTARLAKLVGRAKAAEIIFSGEDYSAEEAERIGWVNRALPPEQLSPYVECLAKRIASFPAAAIAGIKEVLAFVESDTPEHLCYEEYMLSRLMTRPESRARMQQWMDAGFQTAEGELKIGERLSDLHD